MHYNRSFRVVEATKVLNRQVSSIREEENFSLGEAEAVKLIKVSLEHPLDLPLGPLGEAVVVNHSLGYP